MSHSAKQPARHIWNLFVNPIFVLNMRIRLRSRQAVAWGIIALTIAAFIFFGVYLTGVERGISTEVAAKSAMVPLFILQGIILMLLGTGNVASGMALERDNGTLNFQRMTPMSAASKIVGYLFGLPIRQYMMFLLTMPFVIAAVILGKVAVHKVLHFYLVFLTTVWLYHMIGMVSGMITPKARRVGMLAMVAIVILYWIMPQLSSLGFTFFGFVTVIPTFQVLLASELTTSPLAAQRLTESGVLRSWEELQFFQLPVHPTVYTLVIQGVLLLTCFVIVYRKWHREDNHLLSKGYALGLFVWLQFFLLGSLWPFLSQHKKLMGILKKLGKMSPQAYSNVILYAFFFLSGMVGLWLVYVTTPTWFKQIKAWRRAKKRKESGVSLWSDGASSVWLVVGFVLLTGLTYFFLLRLMGSSSRFFSSFPPLSKSIVLPLLFAGFLMSMQGLRERLERKGFLFALFLLWIVPVFVAVIMMSAFRLYIPAAYVGIVTPMASFVYALQHLNIDLLTKFAVSGYREHVPRLAWLSVCFHGGLAVAALWFLTQKRQRLQKLEEGARMREAHEAAKAPPSVS